MSLNAAAMLRRYRSLYSPRRRLSMAETMPSERNPNDNECRRKKYVFIYSANSGEAAGADFRRHNAWWQDFGLYSDELKSLSNVSAACQPPVKIPPVQSFNWFIQPDM